MTRTTTAETGSSGGGDAQARVIGRIVHLNLEKKYGFVKLPDGREPFFHRSHVTPPGAYDDFVVDETVVTGVLYDGPQGKLRIGDVQVAAAATVDAYVDAVAARANRREDEDNWGNR